MDSPHAEMELRPQLKPRGSMAKEEDPKSSHQCTSCRLNPHDQLGRLCPWNIYESSHKENALALTAVGTGGKNTREQDHIRI